MSVYLIQNAVMPAGTATGYVTTGTSVKTMLQVKAGTTVAARIIEWGISFDGSAAATPIRCELIETDVGATVTAATANELTKLDHAALNGGDPTASLFQVGTGATGFTATTEGTPTAVRIFDLQLVAPTNQYVKQYPLGREPVIQAVKFARIRITAGAAVNAYVYMIVEV